MKLEPDACRARFAAAPRVVLGVGDAAGSPLLVPITFALLDDGSGADVVVFAVDHKPKSTTRLRRLALVEADPRVTLLADHFEDDWDRLWWVRADGLARVLPDDDAAREPALDALAAAYPQYREHRPAGAVVAVTVTRWVGWASAR